MKKFIILSSLSIIGLFISFGSRKDSVLEVANADSPVSISTCGFTIDCNFTNGQWVQGEGASSGGCSSPGSASDGPGSGSSGAAAASDSSDSAASDGGGGDGGGK